MKSSSKGRELSANDKVGFEEQAAYLLPNERAVASLCKKRPIVCSQNTIGCPRFTVHLL